MPNQAPAPVEAKTLLAARLAQLSSLELPSPEAMPLEVNRFLGAVQAVAGDDVKIFGKEVACLNAHSRDSQFGDVGWSKDELHGLGTVAEAVHRYGAKDKMKLFLAATSQKRAWKESHAYREVQDLDRGSTEYMDAMNKHHERRSDWHCIGMLFRGNVIKIYDPSFDNDDAGRRVNEIAFYNRAREMREELRKRKRSVAEMLHRGGGNVDDTCRGRVCEWIRQEVAAEIAGQSDLQVGVDWHKLRP